MTDIYKFAAQHKLRFETCRGLMSVENLFQMPLLGVDGFDLNNVAKDINNVLKGLTQESFVEDAKDSDMKKLLEVQLDIVKDVIATKQAELKAARTRAERVLERKKILDAMAAKKDAALTEASLEDLEKKLAALDD